MDRGAVLAHRRAVVVPRLRDDRPGRAERAARACGAGAGAAGPSLRAHTRHLAPQPAAHRGLAEGRRRLPLDPARSRRDRLRALRPRHQFHQARHPVARREERVDRTRRSFRHGRLPAPGIRRAARVQPRRSRALARPVGDSATRCTRGTRCTRFMNQSELSLVLIGFGNVARRFIRLLGETADRLDFTWKVVGISTRHHGSVIDTDGVDTRRAMATVEANQSLDRLDPSPRERSGIDVIRQVADLLADDAAEARLVCIETTVLDIDRGEPAVSHVRAALEGQAHVVTANKGPAAFAYHELEALAESVDRVFFFEGAVMDGVPVFNLVRETMPAIAIEGFRGVINTTCNFILSELERGIDFDRALADMQARGIAEADPSLDIDGWDAAAKTAALVNVLMDGHITPHDVARTGIRDVSPRDVADAATRGRRIRLVASAARHRGGVEARVEPELLDLADPLATLSGLENALFLRTDLLGEIGIVQRTSSLTQTAYALLSDLARISRRLRDL